MLLESLKAKQAELGLSDTAFAARLGISYHAWYSLQKGRRGFGTSMLRSILAEFPEFRDDVLLHLELDGTNLPKNGTTARERSLEAVEARR